jgi:hypothetical protein
MALPVQSGPQGPPPVARTNTPSSAGVQGNPVLLGFGCHMELGKTFTGQPTAQRVKW